MRRKRRIGVWLIITALIIMLLPVSEADAESSASDFVIVGETLKKYKGTAKEVSVPDSVEVIGEGAFQENRTVEKVTLPGSVKRIEPYSFWGCDNLKTVILGGGLSEIGDLAFDNCTGLESIIIPSNVHSIGIQAFAYCQRLESITIPPEVFSIREDAFDGDYLLNIRCETGSYADKYAQAFYERQKKMPVYQEPASESVPGNSVAVGSDGAGGGGGTHYEVVGDVLGSTHVVGNQAMVFMQNAGLGVIAGGAGSNASDSAGEPEDEIAWRVPERAFYRDDTIKEAAPAEGILEIDSFAYARSSLSRIRLPQGLRKIGYAAFYHCDDLDEVELPDTVTEVAPKAFSHTMWVRKFLSGTAEETLAEPFLISGGILVAYRGNTPEITIPEGVRVIAGEAFANHSELQKITLPESLQGIGERAFVNCLPETLEYSGSAFDEAFLEECVTLTDMSAGPKRASGFPWKWGLAGILLLTGSFCLPGRKIERSA